MEKLLFKRKEIVFKYQFLIFFLSIFIISCSSDSIDQNSEPLVIDAKMNNNVGTYEFDGRVFDIQATPDGSIMFGHNTDDERTIKLIKNGEIETIAVLDTDTDINGLAVLGNRNGFATTAGTDQALDGELYRFSNGSFEVVADLAAYERNFDPDALEGLQWKNGECEASPIYTAGPQNNPYNVTRISGDEVLVADAAGNTVLKANDDGEVDWFAILTPPTETNGDWIELGSIGDIICYAQPVPTAVVIAKDGSTYIGELTGAMADRLPIGYSRIWKVPAGTSQVTCMEGGSGDCELLVDGLTSVIDLAIGPDGNLYIAQFEQNSWLTSYGALPPSGGSISRYNFVTEELEVVASNLSYPSAITFDKKGNLWLLENNFINANPLLKPTIRRIEY